MFMYLIYVHNMFVFVANSQLSKLRCGGLEVLVVLLAVLGIRQVLESVALDGVVLFQNISKNLGPGLTD